MQQKGIIIIVLFLTAMVTVIIITSAPAFTKPSKQFIPVTTQSTAKTANGCVITGCSGEICAEEGVVAKEEVATDCMFQPDFTCYKNARCERQTDGKCGWTQTKELVQCLTQTK